MQVSLANEKLRTSSTKIAIEKHNQIEQCEHMKNTMYMDTDIFHLATIYLTKKLAKITQDTTDIGTHSHLPSKMSMQQLSQTSISHSGFSHRNICFIATGFPTAVNSIGQMQDTHAILNKL